MSLGLNWGSLALVYRLVREVAPQTRNCRCPTLVPRIVRRNSLTQCTRPVGHLRPHRGADGATADYTSNVLEKVEADPVIEAGRMIRAAEVAVRRSKRSKG